MFSIDYSVNMGHNDFRTQIMTVEELIDRFDETDATNSVSILRKPTKAQSSRIIESVLLGMPQPMLYIDDSLSGFVVIEGAEHLYAYYCFCKKGMALTSLYFKKEQYEGRTFLELSPLAQSNIMSTKVMVNVLNPGLAPHERFGVYLCLKSSIDYNSLKWCRSKIYPKEYQWIKDLAKEIRPQSRNESLEAVICYMLVGRCYQSFLNGSGLNQIDAVANRLMEQVYYENLVEEVSREFRKVLNAYLAFSSRNVRGAMAVGLYMSVFYNLYKLRGNLDEIKSIDVEKKVQSGILFSRDDTAEKFCGNIYRVLNKMK